MKVVLLRHGKTPGNLEGRYVGRTDESLTGQSEEEISRFVNMYGKEFYGSLGKVRAVYTSPMKRCVETAGLLFQKYPVGGLPFYPVDGLKECDFGEFEYKNYAMLRGDSAYQRLLDSGGKSGFPGGETVSAFKKRCTEAFFKVVKAETKDDGEEKTLVFVVHGGTIMAIMEAFAYPHREYYSWQVKNLAGYTAKTEEQRSGMAGGRGVSVGICLKDIAEITIL